jgi:hypothetical protein
MISNEPLMPDSLLEKLSHTSLKATLLETVAAEDLDQIPPDFDDLVRFVICAVRGVARRSNATGLSIFIYSDAPLPEGRPHGFTRIMHMQDGHGVVSGMTILTSRDANNGACRAHPDGRTLEALIDDLEALALEKRTAVIWDPFARTATVYPEGTGNEQVHIRFVVPESDDELTQDDVCEALNTIYSDNLKNPSGHTAKLFNKGKLVASAEDEIERHLKGQLALFFAGRARAIRVLSQTNTSAGRTDLIFIQKKPAGGPSLGGVIELKVLRGPLAADRESTTEGLNQGYYYRAELEMPFSTLALYDVADPPSDDTAPLLEGQNQDHLAVVRVRRFPIYNSPKAWRDAEASKAA